MSIEKKCKTCELYRACGHYNELPKEETGCEDWEIAFYIYQNLAPEEYKRFIEENPEYKGPEWVI